MVKHQITHYYQPTNHSCSQSAMAILLSHYQETLNPEDIIKIVPVNKNEKGEDMGTINQQLATWCLSKGYDVEMVTADFQIIDLDWAELPEDKLLERMEATKDSRDIPSLGKHWSKTYMQSYIDYVKAGGKLRIVPYMTSKIINDMLKGGPLLALVNYNAFYNHGRRINTDLRKSNADDIKGSAPNHSIVIYGQDESGNYLIADPWEEPGLHTVEPERLLAAMASSQIECDNLFFQLRKKS